MDRKREKLDETEDPMRICDKNMEMVIHAYGNCIHVYRRGVILYIHYIDRHVLNIIIELLNLD